ncbi:MAG: hypothetical protein Q7S08_02235 [bacterium]|nr:hypothetical protein [bacterium]
MALEMGKRNASTEREKEHEASTEKFEGLMADKAKESGQTAGEEMVDNAIFEDFLRKEIEELKIPISDDEMIKIVDYSSRMTNYLRNPNEKEETIGTINSKITFGKDSHQQKSAVRRERGSDYATHGEHTWSIEREMILRRFPIDELGPALDAAWKKMLVKTGQKQEKREGFVPGRKLSQEEIFKRRKERREANDDIDKF